VGRSFISAWWGESPKMARQRQSWHEILLRFLRENESFLAQASSFCHFAERTV
jgi:hypothetical protein